MKNLQEKLKNSVFPLSDQRKMGANPITKIDEKENNPYKLQPSKIANTNQPPYIIRWNLDFEITSSMLILVGSTVVPVVKPIMAKNIETPPATMQNVDITSLSVKDKIYAKRIYKR